MNTSGDAAEQIVRLSLEGVEVAARITGAAAKEIALFLMAALKNHSKNLKLKGKARLTSMLKSNKALEIFSLRERDLSNFAQGAKQYGIVYCVLRDTKNNPDGMCDVLVKADDAPKISRLIERFKFATVDKAKIESEIVAEKTARISDEPAQAGAGPEAPDVGDTEKLLDELLGTSEGKAGIDAGGAVPPPTVREKGGYDISPFTISDPKPPPSGHTSGSRKTPERTISSNRPSVKEELREIASSRKQEEASAPTQKRLDRNNTGNPKAAPAATKHKQPKNNRKSKSKSKNKGAR